MPSFQTDPSGFPVLIDPATGQEFAPEARAPMRQGDGTGIELPEGTTAAQAQAERERRGKRWPSASAARGVPGFGAGASNSTSGPAQAGQPGHAGGAERQ
jgi:hypothetical protein